MSAAPELIHHFSGIAEFQQRQYAFAAHIRNPDKIARPAAIPEARMAIYNDLFYNNIEGVLTSAFPVIRGLHSDKAWYALVRDFFERHHAITPYITELPQEFLQYLQHERMANDDPLYLNELAHYEWVELALAISKTEIDPCHYNTTGDLMQGMPYLSPLAWSLSYQFPVHRISPEFCPDEIPAEATHIVVYRDHDDKVGFLELNPVTARLLQLIIENSDHNDPQSGEAMLSQIAAEMGHPNPQTVIEGGRQILNELHEHQILLGTCNS
jgi:hypothetical protein